MKKFLKNGLFFLDYQQGDILSAGYVIMTLTLISGIFGLIRSRLLAGAFNEDLVGIYFASFVIPDNIFQVLILGGVGSAFIPIFTNHQKSNEHWQLTRSVLVTSLLAFLSIIFLCILFIEPLTMAIAPGLKESNPEHFPLLVNLTRIILFAQIFFVPSYILTGILQSYQRFVVPASAALFYNIGIIIGVVFFAPMFGMYGVAMGIVLGTFLHFLIQLPFVLRLGFRFSPDFSLFHKGLSQIGKLMAPRSLAIALERAKITIDTNLASLVSLASIAYLNFALQIAIFPVNLIGGAIAQAALPFFARSVANDNKEEFKKHMLLSLTHIVFLLAPLSVLLIIFHTPIIRLVFGARRFSWDATVLTAQTLAFLSLGLIAQGASNILARGFYAFLDSKTPLIMTLISTIITIGCSIFFVLTLKLDVRSLALATSIGMIINAIALFFLLDKKVGGLMSRQFLKKILKIFVISTFMAGFSYALLKLLEVYFNTNYVLQLTLFTILVGILSSLFYLLLSFIFNLEEYTELFSLFQKAGNVRKRFMEGIFVHEKH